MQRPVRIMLDRNEDMLSSGGRHPYLGRFRVGFTSEGRITAFDLQLYSNGGISVDKSVGVRFIPSFYVLQHSPKRDVLLVLNNYVSLNCWLFNIQIYNNIVNASIYL